MTDKAMAEHSNDEDDGGIAILDLLELVRRRWLLHLVGAGVGLLLGLVWLGTREPVYRAEATLLLDQEGSQGGILSDLAALTQAPIAISEMEILRSRSVAEEVVAAPNAGLASLSAPSADGLGLGLATVVDDVRLRPLQRLRARLFGGGADGPRGATSLDAHGILPEGELGPLELHIEFVSDGRVAVSGIGLLGTGGREEFDYAPGRELDYHGTLLRLRANAAPSGRSYRVTVHSEADAVERVMKSTRVQETDRNSGVIRIIYTDSDPVRAAVTINGLCRNYLARNQAHSKRRASHTVQFIDDQLTVQTEALESAEATVVALKTKSPEFMDVGEVARALIEELSAIEVRRVEGQIIRAGLEEAIELLDAGDISALSRLGAEVADPIVLGYVESIVKLNAEAEVLERSDTGAFKALLQGHLLELRAERDVISVKLMTLRAIHAALQEGELSVLGQLETVASSGTADTMLTALVEQWAEIDGRLRRLEEDFTDELPEIQSLHGQRESLIAGITNLISGRVTGLAAQLVEFETLEQGRGDDLNALPAAERERIAAAVDRLRARALEHLEARLAGLVTTDRLLAEQTEVFQARIAELPENERTLAAPMRAVVTHGEIVKLLAMRQQEAQITRAASLASAEFIDVAIAPRKPSGPSIPMNLALGMILGLASAAGYALLRESQASGIFTSAELEQAAGLPVVGTIPDFKRGRTRVKNAGEDFIALRDDPEGPTAEAYRALRSNLKFIIQSKGNGTTLAVTSSGPGEGKSVTNIDIALSFALAGKRVLLVDADMRRGSVSEYLRISFQAGLSEVLQGRAVWQDCITGSCNELLHVLPSGAVPVSPGDLLAGERTAQVLTEMRASYDLIIMDVPPVLAVADIECVAAHLDTVLLLCRSEQTTNVVVKHSITRLRQVGANVVATVLNGVAARRSAGGYEYGYGYGQDSGKNGHAA